MENVINILQRYTPENEHDSLENPQASIGDTSSSLKPGPFSNQLCQFSGGWIVLKSRELLAKCRNLWPILTKITRVDGRNFPSESVSHYTQGLMTIPGGWPWDF